MPAVRLSARAILAIGFIGFLAYSYPGYMSPDSDEQLQAARANTYADDHPPIMAVEWKLAELVITGPTLMLVIQGALFLVGLATLLERVLSPRQAAIAAVALLWFPPIITPLAVIWKDSQMAGYLIAGTAAMLSPRRWVRVVGVGLVTAGCAFRHNAFAASIPLIGLLFEWRLGLRGWRRYAISGMVAILSLATTYAFNAAVRKAHVNLWDRVALSDIAGVLSYTDDRTDDDLRVVLRDLPMIPTKNIQSAMRAGLSVRNAPDVFFGDRPIFTIPEPRHHEAIARAWKEIVTGDLQAYASYRIDAFIELLALTRAGTWQPVFTRMLGDDYMAPILHHDALPSWFQRKVTHSLRLLARWTPLFKPYIYLAIALLLLVLMCRDRLTFALLASGLVYELSLLAAAGTPEYRYSHWMITCTCIVTVMLFVQRAQNRGTNASTATQRA